MRFLTHKNKYLKLRRKASIYEDIDVAKRGLLLHELIFYRLLPINLSHFNPTTN